MLLIINSFCWPRILIVVSDILPIYLKYKNAFELQYRYKELKQQLKTESPVSVAASVSGVLLVLSQGTKTETAAVLPDIRICLLVPVYVVNVLNSVYMFLATPENLPNKYIWKRYKTILTPKCRELKTSWTNVDPNDLLYTIIVFHGCLRLDSCSTQNNQQLIKQNKNTFMQNSK